MKQGEFTIGFGFKKRKVQKTSSWTLLVDSRLDPILKSGFPKWVEYFLEPRLPRVGGKIVSHERHFIFYALDLEPIVNSLGPNVFLLTKTIAQFRASLVWDPSVNVP